MVDDGGLIFDFGFSISDFVPHLRDSISDV
jgi:hypothetical protein